jgi:pimeloyl-ACP methyl ester carboxylesterase
MAGTVVTREVPANGYRFLCREAGVGGEPVLLLHGFPETSRMWMRLMSELADAGYHCLAPDQRGYSPGARPAAVDDYSYENLAADVHALAEAAGWRRFHLVAHDWGAGAAWAALAANPDPVASFVSMSIPHYQAFAQAAWSDPDGGLYRSYLDFFIAPDHLAEETLAPDDFAAFKGDPWTSSSPEEVADYLDVFRQDGALTGALNWYRASRGHRRALDDPPSFGFGPVATPTVLLWGRDDPYALRLSVESAAKLMTGEYRVVELAAGHWLVQQCPEAVRDEISAHLGTHSI